MTGWYEPSLTFPASAFSEVNQDVRIMRGGGRTEDPSQVDNCSWGNTGLWGRKEHGGTDLWRGAEMRMPVGSRSEQHLPEWLLGRKAGERESELEKSQIRGRREKDRLSEGVALASEDRVILCKVPALGKQAKVLKTNPAETQKTQHRRLKSLWQ